MKDNAEIKAIELKGIVRNETKLGVQDGQAEDILNLRFMDGSWRASGNGRMISNFQMGASGVLSYSQLYVHTNIYRHLLGVHTDTTTNVSTLYWFANIESDGVTFTPLATPQPLTQVTGDLWITQTGHMLTIIDSADSFEFVLFKVGSGKYDILETEQSDSSSDRSLYPYGKIYFNLARATKEWKVLDPLPSGTGDTWFDAQYDLNMPTMEQAFNTSLIHDKMIEMYGTEQSKNKFTRPFLVLACIKDYDGKFHYATPPVLLNYGEAQQRGEYMGGRPFKETINQTTGKKETIYSASGAYYASDEDNNILEDSDEITIAPEWTDDDGDGGHKQSDYYHIPESCLKIDRGYQYQDYKYKKWQLYVGNGGQDDGEKTNCSIIRGIQAPVFSAAMHVMYDTYFKDQGGARPYLQISPANLTMSIESRLLDFLSKNSDVFKSLAIFITPEIDYYNLDAEADETHKGEIHYRFVRGIEAFGCYKPYLRSREHVRHDLLHSNFYLLREYTAAEIVDEDLINNPIVDLSKPEFDGILSNITAQTPLDIEALSRTTYLPKVVYYYNEKLHIANYKSKLYSGHPIDFFQLHNHSLKKQEGEWFKGVIKALVADKDDYLQYPHGQINFSEITNYADIVAEGAPFFVIRTYLDTTRGEQVSIRYIPAYNPSPAVSGRADFVEDLNPLLTFPDRRATKMEIYYITSYYPQSSGVQQQGVTVKWKSFDLKPHLYLDFAYYMDADLKPIKLSTFDTWSPTDDNQVQQGGTIQQP